ALTLLPVIGQRKASKSTVHVGGDRRPQGYVNGHNTADEGRELRRFDHVREDRRGRGGKKPHGGLTVSGEQAAKQSQKPFKQRKTKGPKPLPDGNPAAFRTWYVPDGVDTGPAGHRNADGRGPRKPGPGGRPGPGKKRGPGGGQGRAKAAHPYGHPGGAMSFPSDHASPGHSPAAARPRGPRPGGPRPAGPRPGGNAKGPRPAGGGGNRGGGGTRGPRGGNR